MRKTHRDSAFRNAGNDSLEHKKLKREIKAEALLRLEAAAKTPDDFVEITRIWDKGDENRERKERYHEICRGDNIPLDYKAADGGSIFPRSLGGSLARQISKGNFVEAIYNCPYEIQELVTEKYLYEIIDGLKPKQKELLYLKAVKGYTNTQIAKIRGQTDRNIRKAWKTMIDKLQAKAYLYLVSEEARAYHNFTIEERAFVREYNEKLNSENEEKIIKKKKI
ncbi:MAG: hypothetical protein Q4C12_05920 [Clostridia bacterium]|nr:hypothetical protein [Clostridia bacterium]